MVKQNNKANEEEAAIIAEDVTEEVSKEESSEESVDIVSEEIVEKVDAPVKAKKEIRGYRIINPNQPKQVYMQTIELGGVKFFFYGNEEGEDERGCLVSAKMKHVADAFKKEKGFIVKPFYGLQK
jgi:hypothetical protein